MELEKRVFNGNIEVRGGINSRTIIGHAAVFNSDSEDLGGFTERISPQAFDNVLNDDVRFLINHDPNLLLGRTISGTLRLAKDNIGLRYEVDLGNQSYANDILETIRRGDISQNSFAFLVDRDEWREVGGKMTRTIKSLKKLSDASVVTYPAYVNTTVALRSLARLNTGHFAENADLRQRYLDALIAENGHVSNYRNYNVHSAYERQQYLDHLQSLF